MRTPKPIYIFRAGKRTASNGTVIEFTQAMVEATVAAYDPAKHEAPLVKGHPKTDEPAYGWAESLLSDGKNMLAVPRQVEPAFAEDVKAGRWKKRSASFYPPDHTDNPVPGVYYLKHIGFLGAVPPSVKGMPDTDFSDVDSGLLMFDEDIDGAEFSDWGKRQNASMWRRLREWLIGEKGLEVADSIIPDYAISTLEDSARQQETASPAFTEAKPTHTEGETMSDTDKARLAALEKENADLKAKDVAFAEAEKKRNADARHTAHLAFVEGLIKEGKMLPAQLAVNVAMLDFIGSQEAVIEFGEGDAKKPLLDAYKAQLQAMPKLVEFGETAAAGKTSAAGVVEFAAPAGYGVDPEAMELHGKALAYQQAHPNVEYYAAVQAVSK